MLHAALLRIVAVTLLVGGAIRVVAGRAWFEALGIGAIRPESLYSMYVYRVLGGFVILSAFPLIIIARAPERYRSLLLAYAGGFGAIGLIMIAAGLTIGLPYRYYFPDPVYCLAVAAVLWRLSRSA
jgi:hypothetical protein